MADKPNLPVVRTGEDFVEKKNQRRHDESFDMFKQGFQTLIDGIDNLNLSVRGLVELNIRQLEMQMEKMRLDEERFLEASRDQGDGPTTAGESEDQLGPLAQALENLKAAGQAGLFVGLLGAIAGLRGWELKAVKTLRSIFSLTGENSLIMRIITGIRNLLIVPFQQQKLLAGKTGVFAAILKAVNFLRGKILNFFGLGLDGKLIVMQNTLGQFTRNTGTFSRIVQTLQGIVQTWAKTFGFITKPLGKLFNMLIWPFRQIAALFGRISGGLQGIAKVFPILGKVAKGIPIIGQIIGIFAAAFDGLFTAIRTEGTMLDKTLAFFSAFISDFIGAPLDLLKGIISWALGALGFENAEKFLDSFSIEDKIEEIINGFFGIVGGAFNWVKEFWTDPSAKLEELWGSVSEGAADIGTWIKNKFTGFTTWISETFSGIDVGGFFSKIIDGYVNIFEFIKEKAIMPVWGKIKELFGFDDEEDDISGGKSFLTVIQEAIDAAWVAIKEAFKAVTDFDFLGYIQEKIKELPGGNAVLDFFSDDEETPKNVQSGKETGAGGAAGGQVAQATQATNAAGATIAPITIQNTTNQQVDASRKASYTSPVAPTSSVGSGDPFASTLLAY